MAAIDQTSAESNRVIARRRSSDFLPKEHGSWSLALEPVVFGLLVAPSLAGGALAVSAVAAFFLRRPLKNAFTNRRDLGAVALLGSCAGAGLIIAITLGGWSPLLMLAPAIPLAGLFLYWDRQNETRATQTELAASSIFALLPSAMAAQARWPLLASVALSAIMLARCIPTVLIVRTYLRIRKGQPPSLIPAVVTTLGAAVIITAMAIRQQVPVVAAVLVLISTLRLGLLLPAFRPDWPARRIGIGEMTFGMIYVLTIAANLHFGRNIL